MLAIQDVKKQDPRRAEALEKRLREIRIAFHAADWTLSIDFATNKRINEQSASKHRSKTAGQKDADFWPMNAKDRLSMKIY